MSERRAQSQSQDIELARALEKAGLVEDFLTGQYARVEQVVECIRELQVTRLRTRIAVGDCRQSENVDWLNWMMPRLAAEVELLPVIALPSSRTSPNSEAFSLAVQEFLTHWGKYFHWIELQCAGSDAHSVGLLIGQIKTAGKQVVLSGRRTGDIATLEALAAGGLQQADAIGVHGLIGAYGPIRRGWNHLLQQIAALREQAQSPVPIWITETGFSTWHHEHRLQIQEFARALRTSAQRVYWRGVQDAVSLPGTTVDDRDERGNTGLKTADGRPKLLYRLWREAAQFNHRHETNLRLPGSRSDVMGGEGNGDGAVRWAYRRLTRRVRPGKRPMKLITGGAGFIGCNLAQRLAEADQDVLVFDNLSRPGTERNLQYLLENYGQRIHFELGDVRDTKALRRCVRMADQVFHLAAQVAVTTSLARPREDFEINALGTLNVLESIRACPEPPSLLFTSTNKVYGAIADLAVREQPGRYQPADRTINEHGLSEQIPLDFHSPYGCSKGAADQYVLDYCRAFDLPAAVFRMSCIYGPHQMGNEDQGWVVHFLRQAIAHRPLSIYGTGKQVRDILHVDELIDAMLLAQKNISGLRGQAFNIGGGPANAISLLELLNLIEELNGSCPPLRYEDWRPGDQKYYVADTVRFQQATGWRPRTSAAAGIRSVYLWLLEQYPVRQAYGASELHQRPSSVRAESRR